MCMLAQGTCAGRRFGAGMEASHLLCNVRKTSSETAVRVLDHTESLVQD